MKVDADLDRVETALGASGNVEIVPIFIPVSTFQILLQAGKERGMSVSDVIARSIELFLQPKPDIKPIEGPVEKPKREVDFRRRK